MRELNVLGHFEFTVGVSREKLRGLYQHCDTFVNPSTIYESFSYANAEAMACGKPVIASDMGGMPETVGDGIEGLVFRSEDSQDLSEKLSLLIQDQGLRERLGRQARERASNYSKLFNSKGRK